MNNALYVPDTMPISDDEFKKLTKLVYSNFGIFLTEAKKQLVIARLQKVVRELEFSTFEQYYQYLTRDKSGEALSTLVNKISTNFTYFYREEQHFIYLSQHVLPELQNKLRETKKLRIWCAGCATGEEAYMLAMLLMHHFEREYSFWDSGVLATDISERALHHAKAGIYTKESLKKIPVQLRNKFFVSLSDNEVKVNSALQKEVTYRRFNLMNTRFPFKEKFHVIFCRNVMIYFDNDTKDQLVKRFTDMLHPGGYLFIGHSESIGRTNNHLRYVLPSVYQKES